jgi:hypothetical protein
MNFVLSSIRNPVRLTCTWVPTGNARKPLACIWKDASASFGRTDPSSPQEGGDRSVRLEGAELAILPAAASETFAFVAHGRGACSRKISACCDLRVRA